MPNKKSAEKRMRSSASKEARNRNVKSTVRTVEKKFRAAVAAGKKEDVASSLSAAISALDKASKRGILHWGTVDRKKSRLAHAAAAVK